MSTGTRDVALRRPRPRARDAACSSARASRIPPGSVRERLRPACPGSCPTKPEASTSSSGKPAAGTSFDSRPCAVPTKTIGARPSCARISSRQRDTRDDVAAGPAGGDHVGAELAVMAPDRKPSASAVAQPPSATSCCEMFRIRPAGDPGRDQRRAAVRHERQRDALGGHERQDDGDVDRRLDDDHRRGAGGEERGEGVGRAAGGAQPAPRDDRRSTRRSRARR